MDYGRILQRAFEITIRHRSIWLFGILASLFGQVGAQAPNILQFTVPAPGSLRVEEFILPLLTVDLWVYILLAAAVFVVFLIGVLIRFFSRAAIIGMVNEVEEAGGTGIRNGWLHGIRNLLRLVGIYLVIWIPVILVFLLLFAIALSPLLLLLRGDEGARVFGIAATVALVLAVTGVIIVAAILLSIVQEFVDRSCVILGRGVFGSIGEGFRLVRGNLGAAFLTWLIMAGVGFIIGMLVFAVIAFSLAVVVIPTIVAWQASSALGIAVAIILGLPAIAVFVFIAALADIFTTAAWTLAYREIAHLGGVD